MLGKAKKIPCQVHQAGYRKYSIKVPHGQRSRRKSRPEGRWLDGSKFMGVRRSQAWIGAQVEGVHLIFTEVDMSSVSGRQESGVGNVVSGELQGVDLQFIKYNL